MNIDQTSTYEAHKDDNFLTIKKVQSYVNTTSVVITLLFSVFWAVLFGIFTFHFDINCESQILLDYGKLAFWLLITAITIETISIILANYGKYQETWTSQFIATCLVLADLVIGLFIYIKGILIYNDTDGSPSCEGLHKILFSYIVVFSILAALFIIIVLCGALACIYKLFSS